MTIKKALEIAFVEHTKQMDDAWKDTEKKFTQSQLHANITVVLAEILANVNGTTTDFEIEKLFNKYSLWKF